MKPRPMKVQNRFAYAAAWLMPSAAFLFCLALSSGVSGAEGYPSKPVRIVHGYQGGNSMDTNSRVIAEKLSKMLGQQFVVEGKPGATSTIAAQVVKESRPDGYTLFAAPGSVVACAPHLMKVPFDPFRDFVPISLLCNLEYLLACHPDLPAKNAGELISLAKQRPGHLTYVSAGVGTGYHLAGELFCSMAGIEMLHVPYRGAAAAAMPDLLKGRVHLAWNNPLFLLPHIRENKLRAIGVTGQQRIEAIPDVPTIAESGLPGYDASGWQGIFAPAGTPKEIVVLLNDKIQQILRDPEIRQKWVSGGQGVPKPHTSEQFGAILRNHYDMYGKLIKKIGLKVE